MMNSTIFKGQVYYKVKDLKDLYDMSEAKINKAIKANEIETVLLEGNGRTKFIAEENVPLIFGGEKSMTIETTVVTKINGVEEIYDEAKIKAKKEAKEKAIATRREASQMAKERGKLKVTIRELYQKFSGLDELTVIKTKHLGETKLHNMMDIKILRALEFELTQNSF